MILFSLLCIFHSLHNRKRESIPKLVSLFSPAPLKGGQIIVESWSFLLCPTQCLKMKSLCVLLVICSATYLTGHDPQDPERLRALRGQLCRRQGQV